jgi:hypothetical protein
MEGKGHGMEEDYISFRAVVINFAFIMSLIVHVKNMMCHCVRCVTVSMFTLHVK